MLRAIVLGLVQGLTEFLPVSSSGHLVVVPYLLSWQPPGLAFDVALHAGTLVALLVYFAADLWYLATRSLGMGEVVAGEVQRARRTVTLLALGSLPAVLVGLLFEGFFAEAFTQPVWTAGFFIVTAALLYAAELVRRRRAAHLLRPLPSDRGKVQARSNAGGAGTAVATDEAAQFDPGRDETTVGWIDSLVIGGAQALALFPGLSRSGLTIAFGMFRGLSRVAAARFSFLLAIPAVAGAIVLELPDVFAGDTGGFSGPEVAVGVAVSALSGYWAVRYLLRFVTTDELTGFARYLVLAALLVVVASLWIGRVSVV
ncbi:MAG: undecaprenyl-diphosphate phosphatase [Actinomycetota bacterium]|nr:undecaprenyl-diphosphate phosphatase [Actinomycetota bacterium]